MIKFCIYRVVGNWWYKRKGGEEVKNVAHSAEYILLLF